MRLRTFGGLALDGEHEPRPKPLLLAAYLALEGPKDRGHLSELFWRDAKDPAASLRVALSQLRSCSEDLVRSEGRAVWTEVSTDAHELLTDLERGSADRIEAYRGPFLAGVDGRVARNELEEWVLETRTFLASRIRSHLVSLAERRCARGALREARQLAERAVALGPLEEIDADRLPRLHAVLLACGSPDATRVVALAEEYGLPLDAPRAVRPALHGDDGQVQRAGTTAPLRLPDAATDFVGRADEIAAVSSALDQDDRRLVTLVGGGGAGKTRLAVEVARRRLDAGRYPDGAFFVDLGPLVDASGVPDRIAETLGVVVQARGDEVDQLAAAIGDRRLLLVLDNYEHVADGAHVAAALVRACPAIDLLVTSRERLGVAPEWTVPIGGLRYPSDAAKDGTDPRSYDAVRLFVARAVRARAGRPVADGELASVTRICRAVAGNPLGIELAAAWTRALTVSDLADELERGLAMLEEGSPDRPHRHRGLRAAFEHSWSLLGERERRALRRLSVFRGGFRRDAAAAVGDVTLPTLARLLDASLLTLSDAGRYQRHPFLYGYVEEKLGADPAERDEARARHGRYVLDLVEASYPRIMGGDEAVAGLERLREEEANILAAFTWALEHGDVDRLLRALPCIAVYAEFRARYHYGYDLADRIVRSVQPADDQSGLLLGMARATRGFSVFRAGDPRRVADDGEAALTLLPSDDPTDPERVAAGWWAWHTLALAAKVGGDGEGSVDHARRALAVAEAALAVAREPAQVCVYSVKAGMSHHVICFGELQRGELEAARHHDRASRAHFHRIASHADSYGCHSSGLLRYLAGDVDEAAEALEQGLVLSRKVGYVTATANLLEVLARVEFARGDAVAAERACDEALRITDDAGDVWLGTALRAFKGTLVAARGAEAEALGWFARGYTMADRHALYAYGMEAVVGRAELAQADGRRDLAASLLAFAVRFEHTPDWIRSAARERLAGLGVEPPPSLELEDVRAAMVTA